MLRKLSRSHRACPVECHGAAVLPNDFDNWGLSDDEGWSVAHEIALVGGFPSGFKDWGLLDKKNRSVAFYAACRGNLPLDFPYWFWKGEDGRSLFEIFCARNYISSDEFKSWDLVLNANGETCRDVHDRVQRTIMGISMAE